MKEYCLKLYIQSIKRLLLVKKRCLLETGQSISTLDRLRKSGVGCAYIKKGNGDIFYPLTELAKYYTQVVQTY